MVIENEQLKFIWLQNKTALLLDIATLVKKIQNLSIVERLQVTKGFLT